MANINISLNHSFKSEYRNNIVRIISNFCGLNMFILFTLLALSAEKVCSHEAEQKSNLEQIDNQGNKVKDAQGINKSEQKRNLIVEAGVLAGTTSFGGIIGVAGSISIAAFAGPIGLFSLPFIIPVGMLISFLTAYIFLGHYDLFSFLKETAAGLLGFLGGGVGSLILAIAYIYASYFSNVYGRIHILPWLGDSAMITVPFFATIIGGIVGGSLGVAFPILCDHYFVKE